MTQANTRYHDPGALVQTDWLEAQLGDTNLCHWQTPAHNSMLPALKNSRMSSAIVAAGFSHSRFVFVVSARL